MTDKRVQVIELWTEKLDYANYQDIKNWNIVVEPAFFFFSTLVDADVGRSRPPATGPTPDAGDG